MRSDAAIVYQVYHAYGIHTAGCIAWHAWTAATYRSVRPNKCPSNLISSLVPASDGVGQMPTYCMASYHLSKLHACACNDCDNVHQRCLAWMLHHMHVQGSRRAYCNHNHSLFMHTGPKIPVQLTSADARPSPLPLPPPLHCQAAGSPAPA